MNQWTLIAQCGRYFHYLRESRGAYFFAVKLLEAISKCSFPLTFTICPAQVQENRATMNNSVPWQLRNSALLMIDRGNNGLPMDAGMHFKKSSWDSLSLSYHYEYFIIRRRIRQDNQCSDNNDSHESNDKYIMMI